MLQIVFFPRREKELHCLVPIRKIQICCNVVDLLNHGHAHSFISNLTDIIFHTLACSKI